MAVSPAPARAVAPRRVAGNKPAPQYAESGSDEDEASSSDEASDYCPSS